MAKQDTIQITVEEIPDGVVLSPQGEVDLARSPSMRSQIATAMKRSPKRIVIDLSGVPYMDSSGVATLVEALQGSRRNGGRLLLCSLTTRVKSILEISRLDTVFTIVPDRAAALSA
ncbi:MAG: STAS domain-containing protein [Phycisphaeraceae bacterium]|nr:STAS domain-containing protein [Phycisphaeraceae bacterium]